MKTYEETVRYLAKLVILNELDGADQWQGVDIRLTSWVYGIGHRKIERDIQTEAEQLRIEYNGAKS